MTAINISLIAYRPYSIDCTSAQASSENLGPTLGKILKIYKTSYHGYKAAPVISILNYRSKTVITHKLTSGLCDFVVVILLPFASPTPEVNERCLLFSTGHVRVNLNIQLNSLYE